MATLHELYEQAASHSWGGPPTRRVDWQIAPDFVASDAGIRSVLDVGYFNGGFLEYLGIRISASA
jgi:hypothetical protein